MSAHTMQKRYADRNADLRENKMCAFLFVFIADSPDVNQQAHCSRESPEVRRSGEHNSRFLSGGNASAHFTENR